MGQRELLSCTALCFVLYQACKNYNQASTAFCALKTRVERCLSKTEFKKKNVTQRKKYIHVLRLIIQVLVEVSYLTFNKTSAFAKQNFPDVRFGALRADRMQRVRQ